MASLRRSTSQSGSPQGNRRTLRSSASTVFRRGCRSDDARRVLAQGVDLGGARSSGLTLLSRKRPTRSQRGGGERIATLPQRHRCGATGHTATLAELDARAVRIGPPACIPDPRQRARASSTRCSATTHRQSAGATLGPSAWQAAFELCTIPRQSPRPVPESLADTRSSRAGTTLYPTWSLHCLQHRQTELLLRPFVDERSTRFPLEGRSRRLQLRAIAGAHARRTARQSSRTRRTPWTRRSEREYIHRVAAGPDERRASPAQRRVLGELRRSRAGPRPWSSSRHRHEVPEIAFVVDPDSDKGIVRASGDSTGTRLCLDTTRCFGR